MLSQFTKEAPNHVTLAELDFDFPSDVYPIGRLDADSEGLLLLSNEKALNQRFLNPKGKIDKTYFVQVEGRPTNKDLDPLAVGMEIRIKKKIHKTLPAIAKLIEKPHLPERSPPIRFRKNIPTTWVSIQLHEGKNRQVRRMFAKIGFPVLRLVRTQIGPYSIYDLGLTTSGQVMEFEKE